MLDRILAALPKDYPWRGNVLYFDSIDSTNTYLKKQAILGAPHGTAAIADCQTLGRGRMGRSFQSPGGCGIYLSVLLRPNCPPQDLMHLTCAAAEAMCDAVETTTGLRPGIKWTNDLVVGNRKIAGILTENGLNAQGLVDYAIIGTGINCSQQPEDFPPELRSTAGSLAMALGRSVDRPELAAQMLASFANLCYFLVINDVHSGKGSISGSRRGNPPRHRSGHRSPGGSDCPVPGYRRGSTGVLRRSQRPGALRLCVRLPPQK